MERMTKKQQLAGLTVNYVGCDDCFDVWTVPKKFMGDAIDRLAAYEDTGLAPEEIKSLQEEYAVNLKVLESYRSKPRWTQQEVELARALIIFRKSENIIIGRHKTNKLWWRDGCFAQGLLPENLFSSIGLGDSVKLSDIASPHHPG